MGIRGWLLEGKVKSKYKKLAKQQPEKYTLGTSDSCVFVWNRNYFYSASCRYGDTLRISGSIKEVPKMEKSELLEKLNLINRETNVKCYIDAYEKIHLESIVEPNLTFVNMEKNSAINFVIDSLSEHKKAIGYLYDLGKNVKDTEKMACEEEILNADTVMYRVNEGLAKYNLSTEDFSQEDDGNCVYYTAETEFSNRYLYVLGIYNKRSNEFGFEFGVKDFKLNYEEIVQLNSQIKDVSMYFDEEENMIIIKTISTFSVEVLQESLKSVESAIKKIKFN